MLIIRNIVTWECDGGGGKVAGSSWVSFNTVLVFTVLVRSVDVGGASTLYSIKILSELIGCFITCDVSAGLTQQKLCTQCVVVRVEVPKLAAICPPFWSQLCCPLLAKQWNAAYLHFGLLFWSDKLWRFRTRSTRRSATSGVSALLCVFPTIHKRWLWIEAKINDAFEFYFTSESSLTFACFYLFIYFFPNDSVALLLNVFQFCLHANPVNHKLS